MTDYAVGHGQAVAVGIAIDSHYAMQRSLITADELERVLSGMEAVGLPTWLDCLTDRTADGTLSILAGLSEFREHLGGALTITLPDGIGGQREVHRMSIDLVEQAVEALRLRHEGRRES